MVVIRSIRLNMAVIGIQSEQDGAAQSIVVPICPPIPHIKLSGTRIKEHAIDCNPKRGGPNVMQCTQSDKCRSLTCIDAECA